MHMNNYLEMCMSLCYFCVCVCVCHVKNCFLTFFLLFHNTSCRFGIVVPHEECNIFFMPLFCYCLFTVTSNERGCACDFLDIFNKIFMKKKTNKKNVYKRNANTIASKMLRDNRIAMVQR